MKRLSLLYSLAVVGKEKAVVAFILAAIGSFVSRHGWTLDMSLKDALQAVLVGLIAHVGVYFQPNKK